MSGDSAAEIIRILQGSPSPSGRMPGRLTQDAPQVAFKTGTSYGFRDAWAAAVSGEHALVVWIGRADGAPAPASPGATLPCRSCSRWPTAWLTTCAMTARRAPASPPSRCRRPGAPSATSPPTGRRKSSSRRKAPSSGPGRSMASRAAPSSSPAGGRASQLVCRRGADPGGRCRLTGLASEPARLLPGHRRRCAGSHLAGKSPGTD